MNTEQERRLRDIVRLLASGDADADHKNAYWISGLPTVYITGNASTVNLWTTRDGSSKPSKSVLIASTGDAELAKRYSFLAEEIDNQLTGVKCVRCSSSDARYRIDEKDYCVTCHAVETELRAKIAKMEAQRLLISVLEDDVEKVMAERNELLDVLRQVYATIGTSFDTTEFDAAWERAGEVLAKHTTTT